MDTRSGFQRNVAANGATFGRFRGERTRFESQGNSLSAYAKVILRNIFTLSDSAERSSGDQLILADQNIPRKYFRYRDDSGQREKMLGMFETGWRQR